MVADKNAKFNVALCQCGALLRGGEIKRHMAKPANRSASHRIVKSTKACVHCRMFLPKNRNLVAFYSRHETCATKCVTNEKFRTAFAHFDPTQVELDDMPSAEPEAIDELEVGRINSDDVEITEAVANLEKALEDQRRAEVEEVRNDLAISRLIIRR